MSIGPHSESNSKCLPHRCISEICHWVGENSCSTNACSLALSLFGRRPSYAMMQSIAISIRDVRHFCGDVSLRTFRIRTKVFANHIACNAILIADLPAARQPNVSWSAELPRKRPCGRRGCTGGLGLEVVRLQHFWGCERLAVSACFSNQPLPPVPASTPPLPPCPSPRVRPRSPWL